MQVFKGIRYASAERFSRPVMSGMPEDFPFESVFHDAGSVICPQLQSRMSKVIGNSSDECIMSEDCLRLSVFTPSVKGNRPVLVWICGGAFVTGSGEFAGYDASYLAEKGDMVVVNVSYRVGVFGFLYNPDSGKANLGIEDLECSLKWIADNISRFGGNPDDITLMGQSAGAYSIACLISRRTGLFRKAIMMSAPLGLIGSNMVGSRLRKSFYDSLSGESIPDILRAQAVAMSVVRGKMVFCPIGEQIFFDADKPLDVTDVMLTCQKEDARTYVPQIMTGLATDVVFRRPMLKYADLLRKAGVRVKTEVFSWSPDNAPYGACHCMELPFILGSWKTWKGAPMLGSITEDEFMTRKEEYVRRISVFVREN